MTEPSQDAESLRLDAARAVRRSRVLDDALRARWLQLIPAMSVAQLAELRATLAETEAKLDALDATKRKR